MSCFEHGTEPRNQKGTGTVKEHCVSIDTRLCAKLFLETVACRLHTLVRCEVDTRIVLILGKKIPADLKGAGLP